MAGSIKLFQFIQKCHQTIGICPTQPDHKQCSTYPTQAIFLICSTLWMLIMAAFLVFKAKSMFDYGFGFFVLIATINCIVVYLIFIWQSVNTVKFIANCEAFIEQSKCHYKCNQWTWLISCTLYQSFVYTKTCNKVSWTQCNDPNRFVFFAVFSFLGDSTIAYRELIEKIERLNRLLCFAVSTSYALFFSLPLFYTIVRYYIFSMGEDSFYLLLPFWFVS